MTKAVQALPLLAALLLVLAAGVAAHGPPKVRAQDARLLADHSDDCGGDTAAALANCNGSHDLVGLDVSERHEASGDVVAFRLVVCCDDSGSGELKDTLTLKAGGQAKAFDFHTSDNQAFQGTGFLAVSKASAGDGHRFILEGTVSLASLGGVGTTLSDFAVEAAKGSTRGDVMPGCYYSAPAPLGGQQSKVGEGSAPACTSGDAESGTPYTKTAGYALRGPAYYVTVTPPAGTTRVPADGEVTVDVRVANAIAAAQDATVAVAGADGFTATWVGANGAAPAQLSLQQGDVRTAELRLRGDGHAAATGTLTVTVDTSLGGHSVHQVPYEIVAAAGTTTQEDGSTDAPTSHAPKDSPAPVAALLALALLALAAARRQA